MAGFLAAVQPRMAVISAGEDNPYGHPHPEPLERVSAANSADGPRRRGARVDDGKPLETSCFVACPETTGKTASTLVPPRDQHKYR
jgi:hypothetical protein